MPRTVAHDDLIRAMGQLLDVADAYAYIKDAAGRYVFANVKVQGLFGLPAAEIVGRDGGVSTDITNRRRFIPLRRSWTIPERRHPAEQVMSCPQQSGDLILPCPFGHFEIATTLPSGVVRESCTSGAAHFAQLAFTAIPHFTHS